MAVPPASQPRPLVDRIAVRPCGGGSAYVSIRAGGWHVTNVRVQRIGDACRVTWPYTESGGQRYAVCTPPPEIRDVLEAAIINAFEEAGR